MTSTGLPEKFVLCGRRHLGHISFDEVDFSVSSFCSGFPFLVSSASNLYLWKGEGCTADELGCARLIAMDIGPTPNVIEVADGKEPTSFLSLFPSPTKSSKIPHMPASASHWRLKPGVGDKYRTRLFHVQQRTTADRKNSGFQSHVLMSSTPATPKIPADRAAATEVIVEEVVPFAREDLLVEGVYVLDAFFEMYIIISPHSQAQNHAFASALLFAQDYGILAASAQDRPFVPVSTVVLEGAPRDLKAVFRRWRTGADDKPLPTPAGKGLKRGGSLRVVGLAAALAAVRN